MLNRKLFLSLFMVLLFAFMAGCSSATPTTAPEATEAGEVTEPEVSEPEATEPEAAAQPTEPEVSAEHRPF